MVQKLALGAEERDCRLLGVEDSEAMLGGVFGKGHCILLHCRRRSCILSGVIVENLYFVGQWII